MTKNKRQYEPPKPRFSVEKVAENHYELRDRLMPGKHIPWGRYKREKTALAQANKLNNY